MAGGILNFDLAGVSAWAHAMPPTEVGPGFILPRPASGVFRVGLPAAPVGVFLSNGMEEMERLIIELEPDKVYYEQPILPRFTTIATTEKLSGLTGLCQMICARRGIWHRGVARMTVLKYFTGDGRLKDGKKRVMAECDVRGWKYATDDEADVLGIAAYTVSLNTLVLAKKR